MSEFKPIDAAAAAPLYNHMMTIAFTVISPRKGDELTGEEIREGLLRRVQEIKHDDALVIEACGMPDDTYEIEPEDQLSKDAP